MQSLSLEELEKIHKLQQELFEKVVALKEKQIRYRKLVKISGGSSHDPAYENDRQEIENIFQKLESFDTTVLKKTVPQMRDAVERLMNARTKTELEKIKQSRQNDI